MKRLRILITAGPTREPIDPARFISNYSTGIMGYELVRQALRRGHNVVLISGPTNLKAPSGAKFYIVETARQMLKELKRQFSKCQCLLMNSAVCDYRPIRYSKTKIKTDRQALQLSLIKNPDILSCAGRQKGKRLVVGFALETENLVRNTLKKLRKKKMDLAVGILLKKRESPFGKNSVSAVIVEKSGCAKRLPGMPKDALARIILDSIEFLCYQKRILGEKTVFPKKKYPSIKRGFSLIA